MTTTFRKSGSFVACTWHGDLPDDVPAALPARRFRSIDSAASEEVSVGWVSPDDPTGDTFDEGAIDVASGGLWLRMRVDSKKLPATIVQQHIAVAERNRGRKLSARERREIKEGLMDTVLPRVIPSTKSVDALVLPRDRMLLMFSTAKQARESFASLFLQTFSIALDLLGPFALGVRVAAADADAIEKLEPTRWVAGGAA